MDIPSEDLTITHYVRLTYFYIGILFMPFVIKANKRKNLQQVLKAQRMPYMQYLIQSLQKSQKIGLCYQNTFHTAEVK